MLALDYDLRKTFVHSVFLFFSLEIYFNDLDHLDECAKQNLEMKKIHRLKQYFQFPLCKFERLLQLIK